jgi:prepilin-type N-terminal cleavage/methylation domain-containing protein
MTDTYQTTRKQAGFSITEILIVIVVVGILTALVLNSFASVQAKGRDTQRKTEINNIATALEQCYTDKCNGTYPTLSRLQDDEKDGWVQSNVKDFDSGNLYDLGSTKIQGGPVSITAQYQYEPLKSDGGRCVTTDDKCVSYTLRAYQELDTSNPYSKPSLNN